MIVLGSDHYFYVHPDLVLSGEATSKSHKGMPGVLRPELEFNWFLYSERDDGRHVCIRVISEKT